LEEKEKSRDDERNKQEGDGKYGERQDGTTHFLSAVLFLFVLFTVYSKGGEAGMFIIFYVFYGVGDAFPLDRVEVGCC